MERDEIRLECLKLAVSRTPDHQDGMKRAVEFFNFVTEKDEETKIIEEAPKKASARRER